MPFLSDTIKFLGWVTETEAGQATGIQAACCLCCHLLGKRVSGIDFTIVDVENIDAIVLHKIPRMAVALMCVWTQKGQTVNSKIHERWTSAYQPTTHFRLPHLSQRSWPSTVRHREEKQWREIYRRRRKNPFHDLYSNDGNHHPD